MTNKFDSVFERIEEAFRKQRNISPEKKAKQEAFALAMKKFEEEKELRASQGSRVGARLNEQASEKKPLFNWRQTMKSINSKFAYSMMGGASIAVLAMVVVAPNLLDSQNLPEFSTNEPQELQVKADKSAIDNKGVGSKGIGSKDVSEEVVAKPKVQPRDTEALSSSVELAPAPTLAPLGAPSPKTTLGLQTQKRLSAESADGMIVSPSSVRVLRKTDLQPIQPQIQNNDRFEGVDQNPLKSVKQDPVSTFSADVDTASYAYMRSSINNNVLPSADSVRIEELINYFDYDYALPADRSAPFKANVEIMPTPWNEGTKLLSIGIKGFDITPDEQPSSNLVFLIDTSGSMNQANKLPLLRSSFKLLLDSLKPDDTISIVTYAGRAGVALEPTAAKDRAKIMGTLDNLNAGGSTAGAAGIKQAYALAERNFDEKGVNRVILATDGDFNIGISDPEQLKTYVEQKRKSGVTLSVLGFGRGNYNDVLMQKLAQNGNGNASYIDTLSEARKVLVEEAGSTLFTIAKDVKLQVEFNSSLVSEYRLIGYETRALKREDFNNDKVDAGDIGAGHSVTALYEITPVGSAANKLEPLRYGADAENTQAKPADESGEYGFLKIRYKLPDEDKSKLIETPISVTDESSQTSAASQNLRFAASVAAFGEVLKGGKYLNGYSYDDVINLAQSGKGSDEFGYRSEFINLVRSSESISKLQ